MTRKLRTTLFIAAIGAPSVNGFMHRIGESKALKPDHLRYINTEEVVIHDHSAAVVLPNTQAKHKRQSRRQVPQAPWTSQTTGSLLRAAGDHKFNNRHSSSDWLHNLKTLPNSSVLKEVKNPVLTLAGWASFISVVHNILLSKGKTQLAASICLPIVAHSLLVSSLGLLLVFRTNSSYQRFLEGRKIWERILSTSRNLSRMVTLYREDIGSENSSRIKNLIASFPYLLRHHIRSGCLCNTEPGSVDDEFKLLIEDANTHCVDTRYEGDKSSGGRFSVQEQMGEMQRCYVDRRDLPWSLLDDHKRDTLQKVAQSRNRPLWICDRLGLEIVRIPYTNSFTSRERLTLLKSVDDLASTIGQCERIRQTAVPLNYARHALRSLTLWLFTLPFCLIKDLGLLTGPTTAVIAWVLFGVYQIGYSIEDPFQKSLRLSILCDAIRRDVLGSDTDPGSRDSAFYIEEDEEEELPELHEPHSLKGLHGHDDDDDFLEEADLGILVSSSTESFDSSGKDRRQLERATRGAILKSLAP